MTPDALLARANDALEPGVGGGGGAGGADGAGGEEARMLRTCRDAIAVGESASLYLSGCPGQAETMAARHVARAASRMWEEVSSARTPHMSPRTEQRGRGGS